ncbi:hypothetical protein [Lactococcus cremoris]|uniref:Uncharacterized protein n=1 Tax=Lactococcus lactis subsp. cremoris TaxID=1359 RepID=A0ABR5EIK9_LACLC|nr:hypothetical protein [Lactococcus cremoris]KKW74430.1 hypothetical protein VN93_0598 [Lactococcus cremoris]
MKKYIHSCFIGIGIASFIIVLNSISYFGMNVVISSLVLGVFQGIIVPLIYHNKIKTTIFSKSIITCNNKLFINYFMVDSRRKFIFEYGKFMVVYCIYICIFLFSLYESQRRL